MANPQLEDGHVRIASELWREFRKIRIPGEAMQCLMFIIEKTYGYHKKIDAISNSQFVENTGLKKGNVSRAIKRLIDMNIVIKNDNKRIPTYCIQKNYEKWKLLSKKQPVIKKATGVIKKDNESLSKMMDTKDNKDNITKYIREYSANNPEAVKICKFFISTMNGSEERFKPETNETKLKWLKCAKWAINRMGNHGSEKVIDIIDYYRNIHDEENTKFSWRDNFQSLLKLQKQNKEGIYYIDYFWNKLEDKVSYDVISDSGETEIPAADSLRRIRDSAALLREDSKGKAK